MVMKFAYISEETSARLVNHDLAFAAVSEALIAATEPTSKSPPALAAHGIDTLSRFSLKPAFTARVFGVKVGSYCQRNDSVGVPRHNSCIFLFDQDTGRLQAVIEARQANAYRTAAANAIAVCKLARHDARRLAIFGAGHQARYECAAVMRVRSIEEVYIVNRSAVRAQEFASSLRYAGVNAIIVSADEACRQADIIVTVTNSTSPLLRTDSVRPGTHISGMGADAMGKQELPVSLLHKSDLFCDQVEQSLLMGEYQHVRAAVHNGGVPRPTPLGDVLAGRHAGRSSTETITIFDSSGIALQDLCLGMHLLAQAEREGVLESKP